jgi:hypothetical protein
LVKVVLNGAKCTIIEIFSMAILLFKLQMWLTSGIIPDISEPLSAANFAIGEVAGGRVTFPPDCLTD